MDKPKTTILYESTNLAKKVRVPGTNGSAGFTEYTSVDFYKGLKPNDNFCSTGFFAARYDNDGKPMDSTPLKIPEHEVPRLARVALTLRSKRKVRDILSAMGCLEEVLEVD